MASIPETTKIPTAILSLRKVFNPYREKTEINDMAATIRMFSYLLLTASKKATNQPTIREYPLDERILVFDSN
jgi:hypothetical protein